VDYLISFGTILLEPGYCSKFPLYAERLGKAVPKVVGTEKSC